MAFEINTTVPELWCSDFPVSMDFYLGILGFAIAQRRGSDPHAYPDLHGAQIMIAHWTLDGLWVPWLHEDMAKPFGRGVNVQFMVPDATEMHTAVQRQGIKPLRAIYDADIWKSDSMETRRQFLVQDPDGYVLRFARVIGTRPVEDADHKRPDGLYRT
jgi:catechol 2,3-dioxygenase-like lactoylglutathione lyase family enzyme